MKKNFIQLLVLSCWSCVCAQNSAAPEQPRKQSFTVEKKGTVSISQQADQEQNTQVKEMPAQGPGSEQSKRTSFIFPKKATLNFEEITTDFKPALLVKELPKPGSGKMIKYNYPAENSDKKQTQANPTLPTPIKGQSFFGNNFSVSTPCDNDLAISDSGWIASVSNTNIYFRNIVNNTNSTKSLAAFTTPINNKHQEFDPKVMYDPDNDRFVLLCLVGFTDSTSKIVLGFSQTNKPAGTWNLYTLPGDPLNVGLWSDYPMIAMTKKELFLSVNLLYNDSSWQTGFVETIVWQINKNKGYLGQPLATNLHSNIKFNGKAVRNLCPAKGGSQLYTPNMYFVSNRNLASQNDTVFLVNITDTINASNNTVTVKALKSNQSYYFPPDGRQPINTQFLATNDSRNLGAFYENNKIQYVHNTNNPANNHVTLYHGVIDNVQSTSPTVSGYIIPNDTMDFGYPNISYAGSSSTDNTSIITFDHSSDKIFPGVSAIRADDAGNYSNILRIQNGQTYVNLLQSTQERWGDYSGSQRRYNNPGEVWMSGYFGYAFNSSFPKAHGTWIAQITTSIGNITSTEDYHPETQQASVYPNPAVDMVTVEFTIPSPEYLSFQLFDPQGRLVEVLLRDWVRVEQNSFSFNTHSLAKGVYLLKITGNHKTNINKKIIIK